MICQNGQDIHYMVALYLHTFIVFLLEEDNYCNYFQLMFCVHCQVKVFSLFHYAPDDPLVYY